MNNVFLHTNTKIATNSSFGGLLRIGRTEQIADLGDDIHAL